jgi:hypothetical protein
LSFNVEQPVQKRNGWLLAAGLFALSIAIASAR